MFFCKCSNTGHKRLSAHTNTYRKIYRERYLINYKCNCNGVNDFYDVLLAYDLILRIILANRFYPIPSCSRIRTQETMLGE